MNTRAPLPPTYLLLALVSMAMLHLAYPVTALIVMPWKLLGGIPLVLGIVLNLLADASLKRYRTTVKPFEASSALVTDGVYHISRHPMYLGMALLLCGIAMLLGSLSPFLVLPVFIVAMECRFISAEEAMLEKRFGDQWQQYRKATRRWL
jgi:protein-S-isoprenylcysteine O-methyltransferase Ste14